MNVMQERIWDGRLPLEIRLAASECRVYDQSDPYLVSYSSLKILFLRGFRRHVNMVPCFLAGLYLLHLSICTPGQMMA